MSVLELKIEKECVGIMEAHGYINYKLDKIKRSNPDQLFVGPGKDFFFVEFKREGEEPRLQQEKRLTSLRKLGHEAYVFDSVLSFRGWLEERLDRLLAEALTPELPL